MNDEKQFIAFSRKLLDEGLGEIDNDVLLKLRQHRQNAVRMAAKITSQSDEKSLLSFPRWFEPVSAGAAFSTMALAVILLSTQPLSSFNHDDSFMEDIQLLSVNQNLEFYENLEFYFWLEDEASG